MSERTNNPPVATHRDGAISAKVWRNQSKEGNPFYSVTFQRTYTDPASEQAAESRSFQGTDVLKVQQLASEAYRTIGWMQQQDKSERQQEQTPQPELPQQGLAAQRDAAMNSADPHQNQGPSADLVPER